jgi:hypothetical protein
MFLFCSHGVKPVRRAGMPFPPPDLGRPTWIDGHGFRNVNRVLLLRCDDPCPVSLFANSVTLELKQNPRLVRARRE